jgi:RimJ/RimL family protein N-acetyltransferase
MSAAESLPANTHGTAKRGEVDDIVDFATFAARSCSADGVPDRLASPGLANAWAKAIRLRWRAEYDAGHLDPAQPLNIIDVAPATGYFARLLMGALREGWEEETGLRWNVRYLACVEARSTSESWPARHGLMDDPCIDAWIWNPADEHDSTPRRERDGLYWDTPVNSIVVIALGYLQRFPGLLYAVNYGRWLGATARVVARHASGCELQYEWNTLSAEHTSALPPVLRERYRRSISNACVRIPDAGLRTLRRIAEISRGRFLWLAADRGTYRETSIRFGALDPPLHWTPGDVPLAVNFHALALDQVAHGAWSQHWQHEEGGVLVQAIWRQDHACPPRASCQGLAQHLASYHPDDPQQCGRMVSMLAADSDIDATAMHTLLRASHYDPRILRDVLSRWSTEPPMLTDAERGSWVVALERSWNGCPRSANEEDLRHRLAIFAAHLGCLDLAKCIFAFDGNVTCLALCEALGGRLESALKRLRDENSDDDHTRCLSREWEARKQRWQSIAWYFADLASDDELTLEPMGIEHADALFQQYRDPEIGVLTRLPNIDSYEAALTWIDEQQVEPGRATYAVMHADVGFVGVVSMQCNRDAGYFYFWMGSDHQGLGYGRRAGRLLQKQAAALGMRWLFTSVYPENRRSLDALVELGFAPIAVVALPPDDDLVFLSYPMRRVAVGTSASRRALIRLLAATQSPIRIDTRRVPVLAFPVDKDRATSKASSTSPRSTITTDEEAL